MCVDIFTYISRSLHVCVFMSICVCTQNLHVYVYVYIYDAESVCVHFGSRDFDFEDNSGVETGAGNIEYICM